MRSPTTLAMFFLMCFVVFACGYATSTEPDMTTLDMATFGSIQAEVFTPKCAKSGCHNGVQSPNLSAGQAYANLVNRLSSAGIDYIEPGQPNSSYLYRKITGMNISGSRMPLNASPLSAAAIDSIRVWIEKGAPND